MPSHYEYLFLILAVASLASGVLALLLTPRATDGDLGWRLLGCGYLLHGVHWLIRVFATGTWVSVPLGWAQVAALAASLLLVLAFGWSYWCRRLSSWRLASPWPWTLTLPLAAVVACGVVGERGLRVAVWVILGGGGAVLAGCALWHAGRRQPAAAEHWRFLAAAQLLYVLAAGLRAALGPPVWAVASGNPTPPDIVLLTGATLAALATAATLWSLVRLQQVPAVTGSGPQRLLPQAAALALLILLGAGWFYTTGEMDAWDARRREEFLDTASRLAREFGREHVPQLTGTQQDLQSPAYLRVRGMLRDITRAHPDCRFAYLMAQRDERIVFLADSEPLDSPDCSLPGDVYEDATPADYEMFRSGIADVDGPFTDRWGTWISATVPLTNPDTGQVTAVFGMDVAQAAWNQELGRVRLRVSVPVAAAAVFLLGGLLLLRDRKPLVRHAETAYVTTAGLLLTGLATWTVYEDAVTGRAEIGRQLGARCVQQFRQDLNALRSEALHAVSLAAGTNALDRQQFRRAVTPHLHQPGLTAVGWVPRVPQADRVSFEARLAQEAGRPVAIAERVPGHGRRPAGTREEYYPVLFLESAHPSPELLGLDLAADPACRRALEQARDSGLCTATGPLPVGTARHARGGYFLFEPVYRGDLASDSPDRRRQSLLGFALSIVHVQSLLSEALRQTSGPRQNQLRARLLDGSEAEDSATLLSLRTAGESANGTTPSLTAGAQQRVALLFAGRMFLLVTEPSPLFYAAHRVLLPWMVLIFGVLMSAGLGVVAFLQVNGRRLAEALVTVRTAELLASRTRQAQLAAQFAKLGGDSEANLSRLTAMAGEHLGGDCAFYCRRQGDGLRAIACWQPPAGLPEPAAATDCPVCLDIMRHGCEQPTVIRKLPDLPYAAAVPLIAAAGMRTCLGIGVAWEQSCVGVLCVYFTRDVAPADDDLSVLAIIALTVASEEDRGAKLAAVRQGEARFRELAELMPQPLFEADPAGRITFANHQAVERFGAAAAETTLLDLVAAEDRVPTASLFQNVLGGRSPASRQCHARRADGTLFPCMIVSSPILREQHVVGLRGIIVDLTDTKRAEAERLALERHLLHTQKLESLGVLAGGIAHDFNNLLQVVLGGLDMVLNVPAARKQQHKLLTAAMEAAGRARALTEQMLAFAGRGQCLVADQCLNDITSRGLALLRSSLPATATVLSELAPRRLPVAVDASQIQQLLMNLITNAAEALGDQPGTITVQTGVQAYDAAGLSQSRLEERPEPGDFVFLQVCDTGCGMDEHTRQHLFEPFFTTKFTGRGLGMSAVLGIVRAHRGAIFVNSYPGKGTTCRVLLPVSAATATAAAAPAQPAPTPWPHVTPPPAITAGATQPTLLVVDDEEAVRALHENMAANLGFRVLTAADGTAAINVLLAHKNTVGGVLLDLTMPGMDGLATLPRLRAIKPSVKVIMATGYATNDIAARAGEKPPDALVHKPFNLAELAQALNQAGLASPGAVTS